MPAKFQQAIDRTLAGLPFAHAFIDDILICTKGTAAEHLHAVDQVLSRLDHAIVGLNLTKCATDTKWLGYHLSQTGIRPTESKLAGLLHFQRPNTLKQLRGLLGSDHQLNKFIPKLAALYPPFRNLLKKDNRFQWTDSHDVAFACLKQAVRRVSENAHFDITHLFGSRATPAMLASAPSSNNVAPRVGSPYSSPPVSSTRVKPATVQTNLNSSLRWCGAQNASAITCTAAPSSFAPIIAPSVHLNPTAATKPLLAGWPVGSTAYSHLISLLYTSPAKYGLGRLYVAPTAIRRRPAARPLLLLTIKHFLSRSNLMS